MSVLTEGNCWRKTCMMASFKSKEWWLGAQLLSGREFVHVETTGSRVQFPASSPGQECGKTGALFVSLYCRSCDCNVNVQSVVRVVCDGTIL